jgi:hypothetical protein
MVMKNKRLIARPRNRTAPTEASAQGLQIINGRASADDPTTFRPAFL